MRYLLMIGVEQERMDAMPQDAMDALLEEHRALDDELRGRGELVAGAALETVRAATTVRVRNGKASITDGPLAEAPEHVGGFYLIDAPDLDRALEVAARIPAARLGSVEVRPVRSWVTPAEAGSQPGPPPSRGPREAVSFDA